MKVNENTQTLNHVTDIVNNSEAITVQDIIWDRRNNKITHEFSGLNSTLSAIAFTKEGETLVTATYSGEIRLWDLTTGLQICELFGAGGEINHVWFSEDEHRLLAFVKSQGSSQVIHWDAR